MPATFLSRQTVDRATPSTTHRRFGSRGGRRERQSSSCSGARGGTRVSYRLEKLIREGEMMSSRTAKERMLNTDSRDEFAAAEIAAAESVLEEVA